MDNFNNIFSTLLSFDTSKESEKRLCFDYVYDLLRKSNFSIETIKTEENKPGILWATLPTSEQKNRTGGILFSGHLDVVACAEQGWDTNPFQAIEKNGKLYARGSCDMKGFIASVLAQLTTLSEKKTYKPVHICLSFDEETEMLAIKKVGPLLNKYAPDWCWVGEPSSMDVITTHRGCVTGEVQIKGQAAHGSTPNKGVNAIYFAMDIISGIRKIEENLAQHPFQDSPYEKPYTVFNIGLLNGGTASNTVPDFCSFSYQYRPHPGENINLINEQIDKLIQEAQQKYSTLPGTGILKHIRYIDDDLDNVNPLALKNILSLTNHAHIKSENYVTEAGFIQKKGIPTIICGPGSIEQAHQNNEFVPITELTKCNNMLKTVCSYLTHPKEEQLWQFVATTIKRRSNQKDLY